MISTPANERLFWNGRAANYPLPFEAGVFDKTERILRVLKRMGAEFGGRRVLDIGCGTGVYALHLAAGGAKSVLGVDSSSAMLRIFRRERRQRRLDGASCLLASWASLPASRVAGRFDVALASMTMAIKGKADLVKMEKAAMERCVYIGWAGVRRNALMEKIFRGHGLEYIAPRGAEAVIPALRGLGRRFSLAYVRDSWTKTDLLPAAQKEIELNLRVNGVRPKKEWIREILERIAIDGKVTQLTRARKAVITWRTS